MINNKTLLTFATAMLLAATGFNQQALAHDTDIYVGSPNSAPEPLIVFTMDYRPNLGSQACTQTNPDTSQNECQELVDGGYLRNDGAGGVPNDVTVFEMIRAVLTRVLDPLGGFKLAFMMNHDHNNNCTGLNATKCSNGGFVLHGFSDIEKGTDDDNVYDTTGEDTDKIDMMAKLASVPLPTGNLSHSFQGRELYFELFRYLTGQGIYNGHNGWTDFGTNNTDNLGDANDLVGGVVTPMWDDGPNTEDQSGPDRNRRYISPLRSGIGKDCTGIYVINLMFATVNQEADSDNAMMDTQINGGMSVGGTPINLNGNNAQFDTVLKWLHDVDLADGTFGTAANLKGTQNVTSFFIVQQVRNDTNGYAEAGGTTRALPLDVPAYELEKHFNSIFSQILSVSTTFVAPSIAVNVYNRAQVQNDLYIAMFEAHETSRRWWSGNIKKFNLDLGKGLIVDADGDDAVNQLDGRIKNEALSFWTQPGDLVDPVDGIDSFLAGSDGRFIERGGCGSLIPGYKLDCTGTSCTSNYTVGLTNPTGNTTATSKRKVFTDPASFSNGSATALRALDATTSVAGAADIKAAMGVTDTGTCDASETAANSCNLIKYARGIKSWLTTDDNRNWMFADPLHSRPLAVNYGAINGHTETHPDIRLYSGTNDGFLHMIRSTDGTGTTESGIEGWAYMPLNVMSNLPKMFGDVTGDHIYGVDGPPTAVTRDVDGDGNIETGDGDYVHLFFGLRRGGRSLYALDVSDPDNPELLWRISNTDADFNELGETWSQPVVTQVLHGANTTSTPVLIFGGGYDSNKDDNTVNHAAAPGGVDSMGRGVFIVDANDGSLIWKTTYGATTGTASADKAYYHNRMLHSIPSRVTAVDSDGNGLTDRIYVGDTGGNIWRIDTRSNDAFAAGLEWQTSLLFNAQRNGDGTATDRRFFYEPDYVQAKDESGISFDAIVIGSGDRAHPTDLASDNYFYVIRDQNTTSGAPGTTTLIHGDLADVTDNCRQDPAATCTGSLANGWRLKLHCPWQDASEPCGEKVLATAFTVSSDIFFTSYQPANGSGTASCEPSEGIGFLYTLNLGDGTATIDYDTTTAGLTTSDRYEKLKSGGIPSGVVNIGGGKIVRPDLQVQETKLKGGYRSFWFENDGY